jgi:hypothetical protein
MFDFIDEELFRFRTEGRFGDERLILDQPVVALPTTSWFPALGSNARRSSTFARQRLTGICSPPRDPGDGLSAA